MGLFMGRDYRFLTIIILLILVSQGPLCLAQDSSQTDGPTHSRSSHLTAKKGTTPKIDGIKTSADGWDQVEIQQAPFSTGYMVVGAKHDGVNLYILVQCFETSDGYCPDDLYFEDDGSAPDKKLDTINEDYRSYEQPYGRYPGGMIDSHWDDGWYDTEESGAEKQGAVMIFDEDTKVTEEWALPLSSGSINDISVTGPEDLGLLVGYSGGWPSLDSDPDEPETWGLLHIDYHPDQPPVASIASPLENDYAWSDLQIKVRAYDPDPSKNISQVQVSINGSSWSQATHNEPFWSAYMDTTAYPEGAKVLIKARAFDGKLYSNIDFCNVTVHNNDTNNPPVIKSQLPPQSMELGKALNDVLYLGAYFEDNDPGQSLNYKALGAVHIGSSIDTANYIDLWGETGWTGTETIIIHASDGKYWTESPLAVTITVPVTDLPPIVNFDGYPLDAKAKQTLYYAVDAYDPEGKPVSFKLVHGPEGASIDPKTGLVKWTPRVNQTGAQELLVEVTDGANSVEVTIPIVVADPFAGLTLWDFYPKGEVNACPDSWVNSAVVSKYDAGKGYVFQMTVDQVLRVSLSAESRIDYYLLNETNTLRYVLADSSSEFDAIAVGSAENTLSISYAFRPPTDGYYVIILDDSVVGKAPPVTSNTVTYSVRCEKWVVPPPPKPEPKDNNTNHISESTVCAIVAVVCVVGILAGVFYVRWNQKKRQDAQAAIYAQQMQQIYATPPPPIPEKSYYERHLALYDQPPPPPSPPPSQPYLDAYPPPPLPPAQPQAQSSDELIQ